MSTTRPPDPAPASPAAEPPATRASQRARTAALVAARIAFDLLVIDAAVETWLAGAPARFAVAGGALLYFALTAYVVSKGGRVGGRGWLMDPLAGAILFLALLVAACWTPEGTINGVRAFGQAAPVVLAGTMIALVAAAAVRATAPGGARSWWVRLLAILVSGYACVAFARAIPTGTAFRDLLTGHGFWLRLPWWLQGTWLGAFVVLPAAFLREVGASIARLEAGPYLRWMLVFALGCWLAFNVASL